MLPFYSPAGFEGYFREIGGRSPDAAPAPLSPDQRRAMDERFGIRYRQAG